MEYSSSENLKSSQMQWFHEKENAAYEVPRLQKIAARLNFWAD